MPEQADVIYLVDPTDTIAYVNEAWDEFARENEGSDLTGGRALGQSLWKHIGDMTTRQLYGEILRRARLGRVFSFPFRCDSPDCRRQLRLHIRGTPSGFAEFRSETLLLEPRKPVAPLPNLKDGEEALRSCGWCRKFALPDGVWVEIEDAMGRVDIFAGNFPSPISHGICEDCYARMVEIIGQGGMGAVRNQPVDRPPESATGSASRGRSV